jgi:hypothetical protein
MKCTQQRCQAAPSSTASIAAFKPVWASETTSWVPVSPRGLQRVQKAVQRRRPHNSPTAKPSTFRCPSAATPVAITTAWETTRRLTRAFHRLHPGTRAGSWCRPGSGPGRRDLLIQVGADPADLAIADAGVRAQGADEVIDLAVAHTVQMGLHHHREQRLVDPSAPLEHRREERAGAQLGNA